MDDRFDDLLENILTVRPRLKKQGNSKQVPSSTKDEMEDKTEREDVVIENAKQKMDDKEKNSVTWKMFRMVADMMEQLKVSINEKMESSERKVMKKMEENSKRMEEGLDYLGMSVRRMEEKLESLMKSDEKSQTPEELKKASNVVGSKGKSEVEVSQTIQKSVIESEQEEDCEVVEVIPVRQGMEKYMAMNRVGKGFKADEVRAKSGAEVKLSDRRIEVRGSREKVEKAKEMVEAVCKETVVIHMEVNQVRHLKKSGVIDRIQDATGANIKLESKVKKGRPSPVCICGTREEVAAARVMLAQSTVTERMPVLPEVIRVMAANNYRVWGRIQKASRTFLSGRNMNTVLMVGSKEGLEVARRMLLDLVSRDQ